MSDVPLRRAAAVAAVLLLGAACADDFVADPEAGLRASVEAVAWPAEPILVGDSVTLRVVIEDRATGLTVAPTDIVWSVTPSGAAEVRSEAGDSAVVRILGLGSIQVRASLNDPAFDTASVSDTIEGRLGGITISVAASDTMRSVGDSVLVQARGLDVDGAPIRVGGWSWSVVGTAATVAGSGDSIHAVAAGNGDAQIVATHPLCVGECSRSVGVSVRQRAVGLAVTPASARLTSINDTIHLAGTLLDARDNPVSGAVAWSSSAGGVANVGATGIVTAAGNGSAMIVGQAGAFADTAEVTVEQVVATVTLPLTETNMSVGDTLRLAATARDSGGTTVTGLSTTWTTTDSAVVSVSADGRMSAKARGTATVRATIAGITAGLDILVAAWALAFDGDDHVQVAATSVLTLDSTFTLEAWVRPRSGAASAALLATWDGAKTGSSYGLYLQGLVPTVLLRPATANTVMSLAAPSGISQNAWHHIAFVYDRGTGTMYVDGDSVASATGLTLPNPVVVPLRLGADAQATPAHLTGDLDEVRIWGTARSAAEIAAAMSVRLTPAGNPGLRAYWPLLEGEGNAVDVVSGLVGVLGGAAGAAATPVWTTDASPVP